MRQVWNGIRNNLTGAYEGFIRNAPDVFSRGVNIFSENMAHNPDKGFQPRIPPTPLGKDSVYPEWETWLQPFEKGRRDQTPWAGNPALYYYDTAAAYAGGYPIRTIGTALGGYVLDQWLNKPIEGLVDTVTFNALNLRPDEKPRQQDVFYPAVPTMTAEDLAYQIKRQQGNMAVTALTLQELQRIQQLQSGMPLQTLQPVDYGY